MKDPIRLVLVFTISMAIFISVTNGCSGNESILRVKDGKKISFDQMIREIRDKKIILIGEHHNDPQHHKFQLRVIRALYEHGIPISVGLEMFRANNQKELDRWVSGNVPLQKFLPLYYYNWNFPWPLYEDIFLFCRDKRIPLVGLNVPPEVPSKVAERGFSSLTKEELAQLPPNITCNVDQKYMESIRKAYEFHDTGEKFVNFCEAQLTWDNAMALHTLKYLRRYPQYTFVILTGTTHAWKSAIPEQIKRFSSGYSVSVVLPEASDESQRKKITPDKADYLVLNVSGA